MKNSLIAPAIGNNLLGDCIVLSVKDADYTLPLGRAFAGMDEYAGFFPVIAQECIDTTPYGIAVQITVIGGDPAEYPVQGLLERCRAGTRVVNIPVHDHQQDTGFRGVAGLFHPYHPELLVTILMEEFTVKRIMAFFELLQEKAGFLREIMGILCIDAIPQVMKGWIFEEL